MKQWLMERLDQLLPRLEGLDQRQEEIQRVCEAEMAAWRARPTMKSLRSLTTPMIDARNAIRERLPITETNSWIDPRTKEREHLALRYLNFSQDEWAAMRSLTEEGRQERLEGQQLLNEPLAVIEKGRYLLASARWEDIAVGLAVTTGRRLTDRHFASLVPYRMGKEGNLFTHLFRACYGTLAVWLFAPPSVNALVYKATMYGHYWVLRAKTEEQRQNYLSTLHYDDYKVGDGQGNIDGRQGIRLGEPGVRVLKRFQHAVEAQAQKEERRMSRRNAAAEESLIVKVTKTGYSMLKPKQATAIRTLTIAREREMIHHDEVLAMLADTYRLVEQIQELLAPLAGDFGTATALDTLKALIAAGGQPPVEVAFDAYLQHQWGASFSDLARLLAHVAALGEENEPPLAFLGKQAHL